MSAPAWIVYRIRFADGAEYVGVTSRPLADRIYAHRNKRACNAELTARLRAGDPWEAETLSGHRTKDAALEAERREVARLAKPINVFGATAPRAVVRSGAAAPQATPYGLRVRRRPRRARRYSRSNRRQRCSVCRRELAAERFCSDPSRSSGLMSRCKDCERDIRREVERAGTDASARSLARSLAVARLRSAA